MNRSTFKIRTYQLIKIMLALVVFNYAASVNATPCTCNVLNAQGASIPQAQFSTNACQGRSFLAQTCQAMNNIPDAPCASLNSLTYTGWDGQPHNVYCQ